MHGNCGRFSRLTGQRYSLQEENAQLRQRLSIYEPQPQPQEQQQNGDEGSEPHERQHQQPPPQSQQQPQSHAQQQAVLQQAWRQAEQQQYSPQQQEAVLQALGAAQVRVPEEEKSFAAKNPDYHASVAKLQSNGNIPLTSYCHLMLHISNPVDTVYYLSKHPEAVAKLWSLEGNGRGVEAIQELNDVSAHMRLNSQNQSQPPSSPPRSKRPSQGNFEPIPHLPGGGATRGPSITDPDLPFSEYRRLMNEKEFGRGGGWR